MNPAPSTLDNPEAFSPDFFSLIEEKTAGTISEEGNARLNAHLKKYPEAFEYYASLYVVESNLPEALQNLSKQKKSIRFIRLGWIATAAVIAAALALPAFLVLKESPATAPSAAREICRVSAAFGATAGGQPVAPQTPLGLQTLVIDTGIVEILFARGARLLIESPAEIQITGDNACRLVRGKAVADVPPSARGFLLESPHDRIVDYGTRFAVDVSPNADRMFLGVLSGEVEIEHEQKATRLFTDYAVERTGNTLKSAPLDRSGFITEMPSHEFPWSLDGESYNTRKNLRFDVTPLMKAPGDRIMFLLKWLAGKNTLTIEKFSLEHDGEVVFVSPKPGRTGEGWVSQNNSILFNLPTDTNSGGRWEVSAVVYCKSTKNEAAGAPAMSRGVFMFEKGCADNADATSFVGRWAYSHDNHDFVREFYPDGTWKIYQDGEEHIPPGGALPYTIENGILSMPFKNPSLPLETATLRDKNTLIFLNRQYRNAQRIE